MPDFSTLRNVLIPRLPNTGTRLEAENMSSEIPTATKNKIEKSSRDFESILLNSWMQGAYASFGSVPGGDDADESNEQYQGLAIQSLSAIMTARGGIGIAKLISQQLTKKTETQQVPADKTAGGNNR